jgi:hypothetical protein
MHAFRHRSHSEILDAVGLDMESPSNRVRHPSFRSEVLEAYGHACAFCGYSVRLGNADLGLDGPRTLCGTRQVAPTFLRTAWRFAVRTIERSIGKLPASVMI